MKTKEELRKDISEHKRVDDDIFQSKKDWEEAFDSITDAITVHDLDYNIIRTNKAGKTMLNLPEFKENVKLKCFSFYHGANEPPAGCPSCNCLKSCQSGVFEFFEPYLDRYLEIRAIPRFDSNNQLVGLIHVVRDISVRKKIEKDLIISREKAEESDRLKSAFLANMSHEIRTPLNGILGFAEMLKDPNLSIDDIQEYTNIIEIGAKRMLIIINDLVNISKIEAGLMTMNISDVNIDEQIIYIYNIFKKEVEKKGIEIILKKSLSENDAIIKTDKEKVNTILSNLVKNAIKFTAEGYIEIGCERKDKYLEFYVKDTGTGIRKELQEVIFERFRQGSESMSRNYEGVGLGLSITKALVEMLGGKIWVESEEGKGSTFYFTLPCN